MDINNDSNKKHDYNQTQKTQKEDSLSEEKIEEFKAYVEELDKKIEKKHGVVRTKERLNVDKFNKTIADISKCVAEGILKVTDNKTRKFVHIYKIRFNNEPCGEDALASLKVEIGNKLKIPWLKRINLFDFPFDVSLRELEDKKCLDMEYTFSHHKYTAVLRLIIREIVL